MKSLLSVALILSASMTHVPEEFIDRQYCSPVKGLSCLYDSPLTCPPGYLDGCITGETENHQCVLIEEGASCEVEMKLNCPANFKDGCLTGDTDIHVCVPVRGNLCKESSRLSCPSGFEDSCQQ